MVLIRKVTNLATAHRNVVAGSVFYASVVRFLYTVCQAFPGIYLSTVVDSLSYLDHPSLSLNVVVPSCAGLLSLPLELLDHIFHFVPRMDLLHARTTCRRWCQITTRFTHVHLVLQLSPNWQISLLNAGGFNTIMDEYALAQYIAVAYFVVYWDISPYVLSITYVNWPCLRVCFFYHLLPNVMEFVCKSEGCTHRDIMSISTPFILPPSVTTVWLFKCSLKHHALERMCQMLIGLDTLELRGILYGHMVRVYMCI